MSVYVVFYEYQIANVFLKRKKPCDVGENWPGLSNEIFIFAFAWFTYLFCSQILGEKRLKREKKCFLKKLRHQSAKFIFFRHKKDHKCNSRRCLSKI